MWSPRVIESLPCDACAPGATMSAAAHAPAASTPLPRPMRGTYSRLQRRCASSRRRSSRAPRPRHACADFVTSPQTNVHFRPTDVPARARRGRPTGHAAALHPPPPLRPPRRLRRPRPRRPRRRERRPDELRGAVHPAFALERRRRPALHPLPPQRGAGDARHAPPARQRDARARRHGLHPPDGERRLLRPRLARAARRCSAASRPRATCAAPAAGRSARTSPGAPARSPRPRRPSRRG